MDGNIEKDNNSYTDSFSEYINNFEHSVSHHLPDKYKEVDITTKINKKEDGASTVLFFPNYAENVRSDLYQGEYSFQGAYLLSIKNYSSKLETNIKIQYFGTIFKDAAWGECNYTYTKTITHEYKF